MANRSEPLKSALENTAKLAEQMEQAEMNKNNIAYLSQRVVQLRSEVIQLQAVLKEANDRIEALKLQAMPEDADDQPAVGDLSDE